MPLHRYTLYSEIARQRYDDRCNSTISVIRTLPQINTIGNMKSKTKTENIICIKTWDLSNNSAKTGYYQGKRKHHSRNHKQQKQPPRGVLWKRWFLEISQNSQEKTFARISFVITLQASGLQLYYKRGFGTGFFLWILWNF